MKKLKFDDSDVAVEVTRAQCNYCGENNEVCFEIVHPFQYYGVGTQRLARVCDDRPLNKKIFGFSPSVQRWLYESEYQETTNIHVCINCVKQMAQYKPKKK